MLAESALLLAGLVIVGTLVGETDPFWMATKAWLMSQLLATSMQSLVLVQLAVGPVGPWLVPTPGPVWLWMRVLTTPHLCPFYFSHFGSFFTPLVVGNFFC